jgi:DNA-binding PadR family transcriptional regulator
MQSHLILGLLRDGRLRHGYELIIEYKKRSGTRVSAGSFYRELSRLTGQGFVETGDNPPDADARRIPYRITDRGRSEFDGWLVRPTTPNGELETWLLFVDRILPETREQLLERQTEELWMRGKVLARARDDALTQRARTGYDPLPAVLSRRMKMVAAELEFLQEFRAELDARLGRPREPETKPVTAASREAPRRGRRPASK